MVGYGGKGLQKRKVLSLEWKSEGVMDDESGESMELMEEVPLEELEYNFSRFTIRLHKHSSKMVKLFQSKCSEKISYVTGLDYRRGYSN